VGLVGEGSHGAGDALGHVVERKAKLCLIAVVAADEVNAGTAGDGFRALREAY
jgi:hypothetical protein